MENQFKVKVMYAILYFLMDMENFLWDLADFIIYPVAWLRRWVAYRISLVIKIK